MFKESNNKLSSRFWGNTLTILTALGCWKVKSYFMLTIFPVRVSDHGYSTLPGQEVAFPGWRESVILEHWGSQAVTGTCSDWNLQPFNLKGRRFKSGCWHTILPGVPLMLRKLKISLASRTMLGSVLIFGKIKKPMAWLICSRSKFGVRMTTGISNHYARTV